MTEVITIDDFDGLGRSFDRTDLRVYLPNGVGEPPELQRIVASLSASAASITFVGAPLPGINLSTLGPLPSNVRFDSTFPLPGAHEGVCRQFPIGYGDTARWIEETALDIALFHVSPPDENGEVSLGVSVNFGPSVLARDNLFKVAFVNDRMPRPKVGHTAPLSVFDRFVEVDHPLLPLQEKPASEVTEAIGARIAELIGDGETVQIGIGSIQTTLFEALKSHRSLRIHSGMVTGAVLPLLNNGAISDEPGTILVGDVIGSLEFYNRASESDLFQFQPVTITHNHRMLSEIDRFKSVNGAIEVDLFGQVNSEWIGDRQVSAVGGALDFLRGAWASRGGAGIIALPATAGNGRISRVVPCLNSRNVTIPRTDTMIVVTEHGVADLRNLDIDQRAEALISIAAPAFQNELATGWRKLRYRMGEASL